MRAATLVNVPEGVQLEMLQLSDATAQGGAAVRMGFLYQIERKQAVLIAERATAPKKVVPQRGAARKNTPAPETTTLGVQMDLDLNEQVEALVARGVAPSAQALQCSCGSNATCSLWRGASAAHDSVAGFDVLAATGPREVHGVDDLLMRRRGASGCVPDRVMLKVHPILAVLLRHSEG